MSASPASAPQPATAADTRLRLLSLNIQVGLETSHYRHYVTRAWRHVLPSRSAHANLDRIARLAAGYDFVALQEADAGSLRTARVNQVAHLARLAGFPHWQTGVTRDLAPFAQHCLGCLSRWPLRRTQYHALPGRLPGRGALEVEIQPEGCAPLRIIIAHLALTRRARAAQLDYLAGLSRGDMDTMLLGDLNCDGHELNGHGGIRAAGLRPLHDQHTFPSWAPTRALDHMLASPGLQVSSVQVLDERLSDHLPVVSEVRLRLGQPV